MLVLNNDLSVYRVPVGLAKPQEVNARYMSPRELKCLRDNIAREGHLETLPLLALRDGTFEVISGHHRIKAAEMAGLSDYFALVYTRSLSHSELVAKQLAHNAIQGQDKEDLLAQLYRQIEEVDLLLETALDPEKLGLAAENFVPVVPKLDFEYRYWGLAFLSDSFEDLEALAQEVDSRAQFTGVVSLDQLEELRLTLKRLSKSDDIRSLDGLLMRMIEITRTYLEEREAERAEAQ